MARIDWSARASDELDQIGEFVARDSVRLAQALVKRLLSATWQLEAFPRSGRVVPEFDQVDLREIIVQSYRIVYRVREDTVEILTVRHGARLLRPNDLTE
jgi:toxin ParE1/3/4